MKLEETYVDKIKKLEPEINCRQHSEADLILCELLEKLGYENVVEEYKKIPKYYPSMGEKEIITNNHWEGKIVHRIKLINNKD